jgi:hypothetical protein
VAEPTLEEQVIRLYCDLFPTYAYSSPEQALSVMAREIRTLRLAGAIRNWTEERRLEQVIR